MADSKVILITGGSSGIGYEAVKNFLRNDFDVILPCRSLDRSKEIFERLARDLEPEFTSNHLFKLNAPVMDLSDLNSVLSFSSTILKSFSRIDVLILNAGLQYTGSKEPRFSRQNLELTFAVNHLAHYFLTNQLLPLLMKSPNPRVVITSSEVHNPLTPGGRIGESAGLGDLSGFDLRPIVMLNGLNSFNADKAYKDSKLCNILFAKHLSKVIKERYFEVPVIAWAPGLVIPRSRDGFFRDSRKYNEVGQLLFAFVARDILRITESPQNAGKILFNIATQDKYYIAGFKFYTNKLVNLFRKIFECSETSVESNNKELAVSLWNMSKHLVSDLV